MMKFIKEHKEEIAVLSLIATATVVGVIIGKKIGLSKYSGKSVISWIPQNRFISMERAKEILDLNSNNGDNCFAMLKEGNNISLILLNGKDIITK